MSKVKGNIYDLNKTKLRGNLRRVETKRKKAERINKYKKNIYRFCRGYYVVDTKDVNEYTTRIVPEKTVEKYHYEKVNDLVRDYDTGLLYRTFYYKKVIDGTKTITAHTEKVIVGYNTVEVPERPVRINTGIKSIRKIANRKFRRCAPKDELFNGGSYKKYYDVNWEYI